MTRSRRIAGEHYTASGNPKKAFATEADAYRHGAQFDQVPYRCTMCDSWHLASLKPGDRAWPEDSERFSYKITNDGKVIVSRAGRVVTTLAGKSARSLIAKLGDDDDHDQHLLTRATGNYRRGNERR